MIRINHKILSVRKQCDILSVPRSSLYYQPIPEKPENVKMMHLMDRHLLQHPTEGVISMVDMLTGLGYPVGPKRIRRLFRLMGHQTIYRRKNLTKNALKEFIKPYLLKDHSCQSGMVHGYYIYPDGKGVYVYDSVYRCLQPQDRWLGHK